MSNNPNISISGSPPPPRQPEVDSETWITASEAASILHLSLRTVLNRAASGKLPSKIPDDKILPETDAGSKPTSPSNVQELLNFLFGEESI